MILYFADMTGAISATEQPGFFPVHEGNVPSIGAGEKIEQDKLQWCGEYWEMTYKVVSAAKYSAGEWLDLVGFGSSQQPTLIYLKLQLGMYGRRSDKLNATEQFLNSVLTSFAHDPTPRCDWQQPPYAFQEVVAECMEVLAS